MVCIVRKSVFTYGTVRSQDWIIGPLPNFQVDLYSEIEVLDTSTVTLPEILSSFRITAN